MEISQEEVGTLTIICGHQLKQVADLIKQRLGRDLRPYDIWYDGFKTKATYPKKSTALTSNCIPHLKLSRQECPICKTLKPEEQNISLQRSLLILPEICQRLWSQEAIHSSSHKDFRKWHGL